MQNQLEKAINLAKKTGDRVIVVDKQCPEDTFVVMGLDEYEKMVIGKSDVRNLTEDELLDKINRDVAIWRSENNNEYNDSEWEGNQAMDELDFLKPKEPIVDIYDDDMDDLSASASDQSASPSLGGRDEQAGVEEDNMYYYDDNISVNDYFGEEKKDKKSERKDIWRIPSAVKEGADEVVEL